MVDMSSMVNNLSGVHSAKEGGRGGGGGGRGGGVGDYYVPD